MIWFFERSGELLRIETSFDRGPGVFTLRAQRPDGTEVVERFGSEFACQKRLDMLEQELRDQHWTLRKVTPIQPGASTST